MITLLITQWRPNIGIDHHQITHIIIPLINHLSNFVTIYNSNQIWSINARMRTRQLNKVFEGKRRQQKGFMSFHLNTVVHVQTFLCNKSWQGSFVYFWCSFSSDLCEVSCLGDRGKNLLLFGDSSPRNSNVSALVCLCVPLATTVLKLWTVKFLDWRTSEGLL